MVLYGKTFPGSDGVIVNQGATRVRRAARRDVLRDHQQVAGGE
jgi:hypothetical protein